MQRKSNMQTSSSDFDRIYSEYFTPIFRYVFSQTKNREISEDIVQIVFFKVLKKFPIENLPPLRYFYTIARNSVIDYWKKKKETIIDLSSTPFASLIDEKENPQMKVEKEFTTQEISLALNELSFEQKEVLTLRFISDLPNSEIAKTLEKNETAIRQIQYRAIKKLRGIIKIYE